MNLERIFDLVSLVSEARDIPMLRKMALKLKIKEDYPVFILIEPTNHCNLKCVFCPRDKSSRELGFMPMEMYMKIIDDSVKHGMRPIIGFQKDGEPLLHPQMPDMIRYAKDKKAAKILHMATNGLLLDEKKSIEIIKSGLDDLLISIDASSPDTYKMIKGVSALERVEKNVIEFMRIRKQLGSKKPFVRAKIIRVPETSGEINSFKEKWSGVVDKVQIKDFVKWGDVDDVRPDKKKQIKRYPCTSLWYMVAVSWKGEVSFCCFDWDLKGVIGNVNDTPLGEIWQSDKIKSVRDAHLEGAYEKVGLCKDCDVWLVEEDISSWLRKKYSRKV